MVAFPSLAWFQALVRLMHEHQETFKRIGYADVAWAVEIQPSTPAQKLQRFRLVFEEYGCTSVMEVDPEADTDVAFTMQATYDAWKDIISNIQEHNGPDLEHTLNRLALFDAPLFIAARDFLERDLFARYGQTFQLFFNGAVHVPTEFVW
jgi:hypothetical protein